MGLLANNFRDTLGAYQTFGATASNNAYPAVTVAELRPHRGDAQPHGGRGHHQRTGKPALGQPASQCVDDAAEGRSVGRAQHDHRPGWRDQRRPMGGEARHRSTHRHGRTDGRGWPDRPVDRRDHRQRDDFGRRAASVPRRRGRPLGVWRDHRRGPRRVRRAAGRPGGRWHGGRFDPDRHRGTGRRPRGDRHRAVHGQRRLGRVGGAARVWSIGG